MITTDQGFTLIELLIAIAVIGIMSAVLIPNILQVKRKSHDAAAQTIAREVVNAMAATEASNPYNLSPTCSYTSPQVTVSSSSETSLISAPLPITSVACDTSLTNLYKVTIVYLGGTQGSYELIAQK